MDIQRALHELGVRPDTLRPQEKQFLDENGYLPLPEILTPEQVDALTARLVALEAAEGADAGKEVHQEIGTIRLADLVNKDPLFDICWTHPRVLAALAHVLENDLKLSSLNARASLPGHGLQALHMDWGRQSDDTQPSNGPPRYFVCNSIWLLSDFTPQNGATRLVPGSQKLMQQPRDVLDDPMAPHPDERLVLGRAGTVVVFNSHTWHGGTLNRSGQPRRALHSYFTRRALPQQLDQRQYLRPETAARISPAQRVVLGV